MATLADMDDYDVESGIRLISQQTEIHCASISNGGASMETSVYLTDGGKIKEHLHHPQWLRYDPEFVSLLVMTLYIRCGRYVKVWSRAKITERGSIIPCHVWWQDFPDIVLGCSAWTVMCDSWLLTFLPAGNFVAIVARPLDYIIRIA